MAISPSILMGEKPHRTIVSPFFWKNKDNYTAGVNQENSLRKKKAWLDFLFYDIGLQNNDFALAGTFKKTDGTIGFSKWRKFSDCIFPIDFDGTADDWKKQKFFNQINQRQILPTEIVLDIETKEGINDIIQKLKDLKLIYYIFDTGSRGYHIHIFFKELFTSEEKLALIKHFGADEMKDKERVLIALEYAPHWKSGKLKERLKWLN